MALTAIDAILHARAVSILSVLDLIEHKVLDQIDRASTFLTWTAVGTILAH